MTQLLFLDTFSHEATDLNLDIVQFPRLVVVEEVRVIPLGGRVYFPDGMNMRLGATLPNAFNLEFFINDTTKQASTFSSLGVLAYDHRRQICLSNSGRKIPTDGLVLRGHYSAVTLAVYGIFLPADQLTAFCMGNNEPEHVEAPPVVTAPPIVEAPAAAQAFENSSQKRKDWSSQPAWPPEPAYNPDPYLPPKKEWAALAENGRDANYYDDRHHRSVPKSSSNRSRSPPRRSPPRRSSPRRSPPREGRSHTRSPSRRHPPPPRRSITPKSPPHPPPPPSPPPQPPKNGHMSPEQPQEEEAAPIIDDDDMSDISDGDIPEVDQPASNGEPLPGPEEQTEEEPKSQEEPTTLPAQPPLDKVEIDPPEDMEEISDEEADWSDDGDCFFLDSIDKNDLDVGPDWVDPYTIFNVKDVRLTPPAFFRLPFEATQPSALTEDGAKKWAKLQDSRVDGEWVETLESVQTCPDVPFDSMWNVITRALSRQEAFTHHVHTLKVRHLKTGLHFTNQVLAVEMDWSCPQLAKVQQHLMSILLDQDLVNPLRIQALLALHMTLNQCRGLEAFQAVKGPEQLVSMLSSVSLTTRLKIGVEGLLKRIALCEVLSAQAQPRGAELLGVLQQVLCAVRGRDEPVLCFLSNAKCGIYDHLMRDLHLHQLPSRLVAWCQDLEGELPQALDLIEDLFEELVKRVDGLVLLAAFPTEMEAIIELAEEGRPFFDFLHHCLHVLVKVDRLSLTCRDSDRMAMESLETLAAIRDLYGLTFHPAGRKAVLFVCSKSRMLAPFLALAKHSGAVDEENHQRKDMKKSAIRGYACEILLVVVRLSDEIDYLYHFGSDLWSLGRSDENSKLFELSLWLQWLYDSESESLFKKDNQVTLILLSYTIR